MIDNNKPNETINDNAGNATAQTEAYGSQPQYEPAAQSTAQYDGQPYAGEAYAHAGQTASQPSQAGQSAGQAGQVYGQYGNPQYSASPYGAPGVPGAPGAAQNGQWAGQVPLPGAAKGKSNLKAGLPGKTWGIIAAVALVCGLIGGVGGAFVVNAFGGNEGPSGGQQMQMPGGSSDSNSNGNGMGGGMGQPPSGGQGGNGGQGGQSSQSDGGSSSNGSGSSSNGSSSGSSNGSSSSDSESSYSSDSDAIQM